MPLDPNVFTRFMETVVSATSSGNEHEGMAAIMALRQAIGANPPFDPIQLGWARFYHIKHLYDWQRFEEAYDRLTSEEEDHFIYAEPNGGYVESIGMDLAWKMRRPVDEILDRARRCFHLRMTEKQYQSAGLCLQTVCKILKDVGRPDLNEEFATDGVLLGNQIPDYELVTRCAIALVDCFEKTSGRRIIQFLRGQAGALLTLDAHQLADPDVRNGILRLQTLCSANS